MSEELTAALSVSAVAAAPLLLGAVLRRESHEGAVAVRITEVEAYHGSDDPGSHAFRGPTPRTRVMFGAAGTLYAYFSYGMHICLNVVTGPEGEASACLLRAGRVVEGHELARRRRERARRQQARPLAEAELARGPGSLARALGVELADSGRRADAHPFALLLASGDTEHRRGLRVGVAAPGGVEPFDWRFWLPEESSVSRYTPHPSLRPR